jgi:pimeloyl-ACP methyl ester carboxylesterase
VQTLASTHHYVQGPAGQLHAVQFGPPVGTPLIVLHGVTGNAWVWHEVAANLPHQRVLALDARGHGDSHWSAGGAYFTPDLVEDLVAFVASLQLGQVDLAGSSWGALVALSYAARNRDAVRKLALVDIEPSFTHSETDVFKRPDFFANLQAVVSWEKAANPNAAESTLRLYAALSTRPAQNGGLARKHDPYFFKCWPFRRGNHWDELRSLDVPVLAVHADKSFVKGEVMERMARETKHGRLVQVADSSHVIPLEQPKRLANALEEFFW